MYGWHPAVSCGHELSRRVQHFISSTMGSPRVPKFKSGVLLHVRGGSRCSSRGGSQPDLLGGVWRPWPRWLPLRITSVRTLAVNLKGSLSYWESVRQQASGSNQWGVLILYTLSFVGFFCVTVDVGDDDADNDDDVHAREHSQAASTQHGTVWHSESWSLSRNVKKVLSLELTRAFESE